MLSLRMGIWTSKEDQSKSSGTFNVLGKRFVVYVDKNENKRENSPDFWVTIKEYAEKD
jgi:hypothetical protein